MSEFETQTIPTVTPVPVTETDRGAEKELANEENIERLLKIQLLDFRRKASNWAIGITCTLLTAAFVLLFSQSNVAWLDWVPFRTSPEKVIFLVGGLFAAPTLILLSFLKAVFSAKDDDKKTDEKGSGLPTTDAIKTVVKTIS
jgi:hypothetical protein